MTGAPNHCWLLWYCLGHVLDGNLEIGAHVWREIGNLIRSRAAANLKCISKKIQFFLSMCAIRSELPSHISSLAWVWPHHSWSTAMSSFGSSRRHSKSIRFTLVLRPLFLVLERGLFRVYPISYSSGNRMCSWTNNWLYHILLPYS